MSWSSSATADPGWNSALLSNHNDLVPARHKLLMDKIISQRLACSSGGNIYVFVPVFNSWFLLMDVQTVLFLNDIMGLSMASVNYEKAFRGYVRFIESRVMDMSAEDPPLSVCIGSRRLKVQHAPERGSLQFSLCERLVRDLPVGSNYDIIGSLSYMSLDISRFPSYWTPTYEFPLYRYVARLFQSNPIGLETVKWIIGRTLMDPASFNKVLCLWGEGMKGKSKLIQALMVSLKGCVSSIPESSLVSMSTGIPSDVREIVVSNRLVVAGDVDTHYKRTNLAFLKSITGQDYMSIPPTSVKSRCSLVYSTNTLDSPRDNPEWSTVAIARRYNVVHMKTNISGGVAEEVPQDMDSRIDWVCHCLYTVVRNPYMPMSLEDLLLSLIGSELMRIAPYLSYVDPRAADASETIEANCILASCMGVQAEEVGELAMRRTRSNIKEIDGTYYVVGIVPSINYEWKKRQS